MNDENIPNHEEIFAEHIKFENFLRQKHNDEYKKWVEEQRQHYQKRIMQDYMRAGEWKVKDIGSRAAAETWSLPK